MTQPRGEIHEGRGTSSKVDARFLEHQRQEFDDGWTPEPEAGAVPTEIFQETPRTIITRNHPRISRLKPRSTPTGVVSMVVSIVTPGPAMPTSIYRRE